MTVAEFILDDSGNNNSDERWKLQNNDGTFSLYTTNDAGTTNRPAYGITRSTAERSYPTTHTFSTRGVSSDSYEARYNHGGWVWTNYGDGNITGTATKMLAVTSSGKVVEEDLPNSSFDGDYGSLTNTPTTFAPSAHTHAISDVTNLQTELNAKINTSVIGAASGVAGLDADGKVPATQLPSYVDDIIEATDLTALNALQAADKQTGKIYVTTSDNKTYRWSGSAFVEVSAALATADNLTTARTISLSGDAAGSVSFDGSADADIAVTIDRDIPQNAQTGAYVLAASDAGGHVSITTGGITVNSSVFAIGDAVSIYNDSGSDQTITQGASVSMRSAGTADTGDRTLAQYGLCTLLCVAADTFVISGAGLT